MKVTSKDGLQHSGKHDIETTVQEAAIVVDKHSTGCAVFNTGITAGMDEAHSVLAESGSNPETSANDFIEDFNTYRYLKPSHAFGTKGKHGRKLSGVKSLFNNYRVVLTDADSGDSRNQLFDSMANRRQLAQDTKCSIKDLVEASQKGLMGREMYQYSDFMYCKHLGEMPNSYLVTLRRFAFPCSDNISHSPYTGRKTKHGPDIGRMVCWMNTSDNKLEDILKYSYQMHWEEHKAEFQDMDRGGDDAMAGPMGKILNTFTNSQHSMQAMQGTAAGSSVSGLQSGGGDGGAPLAGNEAALGKRYDKNKIYGPIDVLMRTQMRAQGLETSQEFNITFDYEMKAYNGINQKQAFLDLLANIFCTTYNTGHFWGGAVWWYGASQSNTLQNLYGGTGKASTPVEYASIFANNVANELKKVFQGFKSDPKGSVLSMASNALGSVLGGFLNKLGRPQVQALNSLLSPDPTGLWHLTIGNPRNPIMSIGNLCLKNTEITHYGPMGIDDFPTKIKVKVTLMPGKDRDLVGLEQMYKFGESRIYSPMFTGNMKKYFQPVTPGAKTETDETSTEAQSGSADSTAGTGVSPEVTAADAAKTPDGQLPADFIARMFGSEEYKDSDSDTFGATFNNINIPNFKDDGKPDGTVEPDTDDEPE